MQAPPEWQQLDAAVVELLQVLARELRDLGPLPVRSHPAEQLHDPLLRRCVFPLVYTLVVLVDGDNNVKHIAHQCLSGCQHRAESTRDNQCNRCVATMLMTEVHSSRFVCKRG